jgi:2'-5' RNA ligase
MSQHPDQTHRLLVAFDPPVETRDHLSALAGAVALQERWARPTHPANLHATVLFIGQVAPIHLDRMIPALFDTMRGAPVETRIVGLAARPSTQRARVIAAEYADPNGLVAGLARRIAQTVTDTTGTPVALHDPFWPHLTLARLSRPSHVRRFPNSRGEHVFAFHRITLYDSYISSSGPRRYHALMTVPLDSQGERK